MITAVASRRATPTKAVHSRLGPSAREAPPFEGIHPRTHGAEVVVQNRRLADLGAAQCRPTLPVVDAGPVVRAPVFTVRLGPGRCMASPVAGRPTGEPGLAQRQPTPSVHILMR